MYFWTFKIFKFYLNVSFVDVHGTRKLGFLSHSFGKNHDLLKKEDSHFL